MKGERLFHLLGLIDEDLIDEADAPLPRKRRWRSALTAAACLAVMAAGGLYWFSGGSHENSSTTVSTTETTAESTTEESSEVTSDVEPLSVEGSSFMSYAGPVFPLTLTEEAEGLTAERRTLWDFGSGTERPWDASVTDSYLLMNHTTGEILAMAAYPVAGTLESLATEPPALLVNGAESDWALYAGSYAGDFRGTGEDDGSTWNLAPPDNWTDYQVLLEDGSYFRKALEDRAPLTQEVTVYEFTDFTAPADYEAATQAVSFTIDETRTQILTYGFNGCSWDEAGWRQYDYFAGHAIRAGGTSKFLMVLGEDIPAYTLQGYVNGACDPGDEISGVSCTVTRSVMTLDEIIKKLCQLEAEAYLRSFRPKSGTPNLFGLLTPELYQRAVTELLTTYGPLAEDGGTDRYADGRLDEVLQEVLHQERVLYLLFPVTIPAGGSVEITAQLQKEPSFDFGVSGGRLGFDLVTTLGSSLTFTRQTAAIANTESIQLAAQDFGFDPDAGITEVLLDPLAEHYYLEIQSIQ